MSQINYFKGCSPDDPDRPQTKVISLLGHESVVDGLRGLREQLENTGDPKDDRAQVWWLLFDDVLDALGIFDQVDRLLILGSNVTEIVEAILAQRAQPIAELAE